MVGIPLSPVNVAAALQRAGDGICHGEFIIVRGALGCCFCHKGSRVPAVGIQHDASPNGRHAPQQLVLQIWMGFMKI